MALSGIQPRFFIMMDWWQRGMEKESVYLSMSLNIFLKTWNKHPAPWILNASSASGCKLISLRNWITSLYNMYAFISPKRMRKPAETEVPMIPPICENAPNFFETAEAVAATTMEVIMTILNDKGQLYMERERGGG